MNTTTAPEAPIHSVIGEIDAACARIAPTWPLDQFIAVNPYWGWRDQTSRQAAAMLGTLAGTRLTMPRSWFRSEWAAGRLTRQHLDAVAHAHGDLSLAEVAEAALDDPDAEITRLPLVTDLRDLGPGPRKGQTWTDLVAHQISQHCAAYFDRYQGTWHLDRGLGLFAGWKGQVAADRAVTWRHGRPWLRDRLASLPAEVEIAIDHMLSALGIPPTGRTAYLTGLLLSVNGWAAWCAYDRWQARLGGTDDHEIVDLLAIRLTWEWLLHDDADATQHVGSSEQVGAWRASVAGWTEVEEMSRSLADQQRVDWHLQEAVERSYQQQWIEGLAAGPLSASKTPAVQAVFCIDVRSEVFRRSLESVSSNTHTRGFAGFFGLPISYTPVGSALTRPQLPGLLAPALSVGETAVSADEARKLSEQRTETLAQRQRWSRFRSAPSSVFSFVESMGLIYGPKLVADGLPSVATPSKWEDDGLREAVPPPQLTLVREDPAAAADIANRVLRGMGLVQGFAPLVLLCGHGSQSANNPHAAGLDCGACGGQTGEVNSRVLADMLNSPEVRDHLRVLGIDIPVTTSFLGGLHNTTTDEVTLFDSDLPTGQRAAEIEQLRKWLSSAGEATRAERADSLGLGAIAADPTALKRAVLERANDWSQVRPEWGLAGNAAFVVAPRARTRELNLEGRSFLHDYDWKLDPDLSVLTLIMTAPMVVTNWINMQYLASTVDNRRYGSGNKVLHNVVGGNIGVFEGNGGDLRIGLPMQSLHDGETLRHPPLRLSVFIEAPRDGIDAVISAHMVVHDLVANGWLHLLRVEPADGTVERWTRSGWESA